VVEYMEWIMRRDICGRVHGMDNEKEYMW